MIVPDQIVPAMTRNDRTCPLRRITIRIKKKNFLIYETQGRSCTVNAGRVDLRVYIWRDKIIPGKSHLAGNLFKELKKGESEITSATQT
jgi:hypothetical protein